jgi:hypothetical protein
LSQSQSPTPSPLLSADPKATLTFSAEQNGSLRVLYQGWEDAKVFPPGRGVEVVVKGGKVLVFRKEPAPAEIALDPYETGGRQWATT